MAKVTYHSAKGLVVESGTGFQVNDAPILEEIETLGEGDADGEDLNNFGVSSITLGAGAETTTLPAGDAAGQMKTVVLAATGGGALTINDDATVPSAIGDNLTAAGDWVHLVYSGSEWLIVAELTTP